MMTVRHTTGVLLATVTALLITTVIGGCDSDEPQDKKPGYIDSVLNARKQAEDLKCRMTLKDLDVAFRLYTLNHKGKVPPTLEELAKAADLTPAQLRCPAKGGKPYVYIPPTSVAAKSAMVIIRDAEACHDGKINALRLNGAVVSLSADDPSVSTQPARGGQP